MSIHEPITSLSTALVCCPFIFQQLHSNYLVDIPWLRIKHALSFHELRMAYMLICSIIGH